MTQYERLRQTAQTVRDDGTVAWKNTTQDGCADAASAEVYTYSGDAMELADRAEWLKATGRRSEAAKVYAKGQAKLELAVDALLWLRSNAKEVA